MYMMDQVKSVKLTPKAKAELDAKMCDWPTFQKHTSGMGMEEVLLAFRYEIERPRIRRNILNKLVGMFNRRAAQRNQAQVDRFLAELADEAA